jgi:hypothetical protein
MLAIYMETWVGIVQSARTLLFAATYNNCYLISGCSNRNLIPSSKGQGQVSGSPSLLFKVCHEAEATVM